MNAVELRDQVIAEALTSVEKHEKEHRRAGCLEGLKLCQAFVTPEEFETALAARLRHEQELRITEAPLDQYWRYRSATAQIEFVWERMKVAWGIGPTWSAMAALQVARILKAGHGKEKEAEKERRGA